jgi:hypothetical protein
MAIAGLIQPDWQQPWFAPVADIGRAALADTGDDDVPRRLDRLLTRSRPSALLTAGRVQRPLIGQGSLLHFVSPDAVPPGVAHDTHVWETGAVPVRNNANDFFGGLAWLAYPRIKASLNRLLAGALAATEAGAPARAMQRDAATLLVEHGLVFACANDSLAIALRRFDWHSLFVSQRTATLMQTEAWAVGRTLFDRLCAPAKAVIAQALIVPVDDAYFRSPLSERLEIVDRRASAWLDHWPLLAPRDLVPLPVLGLPGWCAENVDPTFYQDSAVFPPRRADRPAGPDDV